MLSETELKILSSFFPEGKEITLKIIQKRSKLSYEPVHRILKQLAGKKLLFEKKFGKTLVYNLEFDKEEHKLAFYHYMTERVIAFSKKHNKVFRAIKELERELFDIIILFGSYSKGTETKNSDVDLMIVTDEKNKENEVYGLKHVYNLNFAPAFVKKQEFPKIKKENNILWKSLKNFSIVFKGIDLYYYWMYKNESN